MYQILNGKSENTSDLSLKQWCLMQTQKIYCHLYAKTVYRLRDTKQFCTVGWSSRLLDDLLFHLGCRGNNTRTMNDEEENALGHSLHRNQTIAREKYFLCLEKLSREIECCNDGGLKDQISFQKRIGCGKIKYNTDPKLPQRTEISESMRRKTIQFKRKGVL